MSNINKTKFKKHTEKKNLVHFCIDLLQFRILFLKKCREACKLCARVSKYGVDLLYPVFQLRGACIGILIGIIRARKLVKKST